MGYLMREDQFTNTEHDAALYEARRGQDDYPDDRPTRAEAERDEAEVASWNASLDSPYKRGVVAAAATERDACRHLHQIDKSDWAAWPPVDATWVCADCGEVCNE
jgi:hypothetical protein